MRYFMLVSILLTGLVAAQADPGDTLKPLTPKEFRIESNLIANQMDSLMALHVFKHKRRSFPPKYDSSFVPNFSDSVYAKRLRHLNAQTPLDLTYNSIVRGYIDMYAMRRRTQVMRMLALGEYYFPIFEEALDRYKMPIELKYLAVVESALNPKARSRVGATGLWQFMLPTGKLMGLEVNSYVDERSDPIKSTEAACQYMLRLYKMFGDWNLVLAAYNSGPGNVNKAIRRSGGKKNYWELRAYLPKETAGYVPAFIAAVYTMSYAKEHNLYPSLEVPYFGHTDTVLVREQISFDQLNMWLGIDRDVVEFLNPSYKLNIIPKIEGKKYYLVLPSRQMGLFLDNEDSLYTFASAEFKTAPPAAVAQVVNDERSVHRVKSGESLGGISKKYGVSVSDLKRWNSIKSNTIHPGQRLTIYQKGGSSSATATASTTPKKTTENGTSYYVVQKGDTLFSISQRYPGVSADNLGEWNNIKNGKIQPGMKLVVQKGSNAN
jgi:membrane-bound lytic murein transglycosylase D